MSHYFRSLSMPSDLILIIREVRSRWRFRLVLRGLAGVTGVALVLLLIAAFGLEWARFSGASIITARVGMFLALAVSVVWFLILPLRRKVTDEQVALYLEEHEPALQVRLISAVEAEQSGKLIGSSILVRRLVEQAIETCTATDAVRGTERSLLRRQSAALTAVVVLTLASMIIGPAFFRNALSAIVFVSRTVEAAAPYRIQVNPGNTVVPQGADQEVSAVLEGFTAEDVTLNMRRSPTSSYEMMPLIRAENGQYDGILFDVEEAMEYFVEATGVRSRVFTLEVVEVPYVDRLEIEYRFPSYTGLDPQIIENGGDIAVLRGTWVTLRIFPTMMSTGGRIALNEDILLPLTVESNGSMVATFTASNDGFYYIELDAPTGERVAASPEYTIDVLSDKAPTVSFNIPGRDIQASPIEELYVEALAQDDFGVRDLELVYSINGQEEQRVDLFQGRSRLAEVIAGHTFYLEELELQAGDSLSYYATATDNAGEGEVKHATSDLYFLRIRPFSRDFREAQSQGGGGGGGGGQVDALSEQERQIVSATFNIQRERETFSDDEFRENVIVVALSQSQLREQVEGLITRMNSQLVEQDPAFQAIAELLPKAVEAMSEAEQALNQVDPDRALTHEHRALQLLQTAEEEYETQVTSGGGGGGGGSGGGAMQQELAEIFEQELDQLATRYENANRAQQQQADHEIDELLERLRELARRQEQEAERQQRRALDGRQVAGGGGADQRVLAEEAEEAARRLERLSREENRPDLASAARQLRESADTMRRAAASGDAAAAAQAAAALEQLRDTQQQLQQAQGARVERDIRDALEQANGLLQDQQQISDRVELTEGLTLDGRRAMAQEISERKGDLEAGLSALEGHLDQAARDAAVTERAASREIAEAAGTIRDERLRDKVRFSRAMVNRGSDPRSLSAAENDILNGIAAVQDELEDALAALGESGLEPREQAIDQTGRLARGLDSLRERTQERALLNQEEVQQGQQASSGTVNGGEQLGLNGGFGLARDGLGLNHGDLSDWDLSDEDIRQFRDEIQRWTVEAIDLQNLLRENGEIDLTELDEIINALRRLEDQRIYQDVEELVRLQSFVAEELKRFEFNLRRQVGQDATQLVLSGSDEVPKEFRELVEQYYRSLAQTPR
jgi:hypothetical protein